MPRAAAVADAGAARSARLRRRIIVVGIIALVANAGASSYDAWRSYRQSIADTSRELANVARILAEQLAGNLQTIDVLLRDTSDWYARESARTAPGLIDAALANRAAGLPQLAAMTIADAKGRQQYRSHSPTSAAVDDISDRSYFIVQRDRPDTGLFVSEPIVTRSGGRNAIVLSRRLVDERGRFAGVVTAIIELDDFQRFYHMINLGTHSAIVLVHDNGTLVLREPPLPDQVGKPFAAAAAAVGSAGEDAVPTPIDGARRFMAGARVGRFPLVVSVGREDSVVLGPWRDEALRVAARTLILTLLGGAAIAALVAQLARGERNERALRESEEHYALAMEGANEGHFDWNLGGGPSFVSQTMKLLYGRDAGTPMLTRDDFLASVDIHPDDRPRMEATVRSHFEGRTDRYEIEYRVRHPDGRWHWLLVRGRCLRDATGAPHRFVGSAIDVTARKDAEAERERLEIQLRKSQKLEAMGTLAGGIAHDFNNILGAILGYGELAHKSTAPGTALRRYLDSVMHAGNRAKALVERILMFSRTGVGQRALVAVQSVVEETLDLVAATMPAGVGLQRQLDAGEAAALADATQLHQVVMNLCTNALQAITAKDARGSGDEVLVRLERVSVARATSLSHGELAAGAYVRLAVSDTGTGIAPDVLERMFDPFYTTKDVGQGTGLGLSLVHGIVADLGGGIDVSTAIGGGSTFAVWLPLAGAAPPRRTHDAVDDLVHGNGEAVMVVDDEQPLVELCEEMLARLGYEPIGFSSSGAALDALRRDPQRFELVLTDEAMPGLAGSELARLAHDVRADLPVILMSGFSDAAVVGRARDAGVVAVLRKPITEAVVADAVARALARERDEDARERHLGRSLDVR